MLFQLRLLSEIECTEWQVCTFKLYNTIGHIFTTVSLCSQTKLDSFSTAIVTDISQNCNCPLTTEDVFGDTILCGAGSMVYRAGIGATSQLSATDITTIMNNWMEQSSVLIIDGDTVEIDFDPSCPLLISSLTEPVCDGSDGTSRSSASAPLLAGIIVGVCVVLIVMVILIFIVMFKCQRKTDKIRYALFCDMVICAICIHVSGCMCLGKLEMIVY